MTNSKTIYSISEIASLFNVTTSYVYRLVRQGKLKTTGLNPLMSSKENLQSYCLAKLPCISTLFLGR